MWECGLREGVPGELIALFQNQKNLHPILRIGKACQTFEKSRADLSFLVQRYQHRDFGQLVCSKLIGRQRAWLCFAKEIGKKAAEL